MVWTTAQAEVMKKSKQMWYSSWIWPLIYITIHVHPFVVLDSGVGMLDHWVLRISYPIQFTCRKHLLCAIHTVGTGRFNAFQISFELPILQIV